MKAFVASKDRYPNDKSLAMRRISVPMLILSGELSIATAKFTDPELERLIPVQVGKRVIFEGATHIMMVEQPLKFRETVLGFINY